MARLTSLNVISAQEHLRDQVANALRAALIAGELRPGLIYSAPALASEFGVSATPVREAMLDLAREGLVEAVRNKGFRITELTEQDLDDFTELRAMIEVPTVGRIAGMGKTRELEALRPLASAIVDAAREHDILGYLEADRRFHLELLALGATGVWSRRSPTCGSARGSSGSTGLLRQGSWSRRPRSTSSSSTSWWPVTPGVRRSACWLICHMSGPSGPTAIPPGTPPGSPRRETSWGRGRTAHGRGARTCRPSRRPERQPAPTGPGRPDPGRPDLARPDPAGLPATAWPAAQPVHPATSGHSATPVHPAMAGHSD